VLLDWSVGRVLGDQAVCKTAALR